MRLDARNRLVAGELERRWNEKLEEIETVNSGYPAWMMNRWSLSSEEEERIRWMGENFAEVWHSDRCPPTLKKMIFRTVIEEIVVRTDTQRRPWSSRFTGKAVRTLNSRSSGRVPQQKRRHPWRLWRSFAGWRFAMVTTRLLPC